MALHIQDKETDRMVREFARRRGVGITDAVKLAVTEAAKADERRLEVLRLRVQPLIDEVRAGMKKNNTTAEDVKRFMDEGWDDL
jgi:antitoxin VapB